MASPCESKNELLDGFLEELVEAIEECFGLQVKIAYIRRLIDKRADCVAQLGLGRLLPSVGFGEGAPPSITISLLFQEASESGVIEFFLSDSLSPRANIDDLAARLGQRLGPLKEYLARPSALEVYGDSDYVLLKKYRFGLSILVDGRHAIVIQFDSTERPLDTLTEKVARFVIDHWGMFVTQLVDESDSRPASPLPETRVVQPVPRLSTGPDAKKIVGRSDAITKLCRAIDRVAKSEAAVLIRGETGTGKELVANSVHASSGRKGAFVARNCAGLEAGVLESELFGHEAGAFTDARVARKGLIRSADGGTLFLDEVGEMNLVCQAKLLRVLEDKVVRPLGSDRSFKVDIRLVAATHRDLEMEVREGRFREDLFYRLSVVTLAVPPLRERRDDVPLLANLFLENGKRLSPNALSLLCAYDWPGNVRELKNKIVAACLLAQKDEVDASDFTLNCSVSSGAPTSFGMSSLDDIIRNAIVATLKATDGNVTEAARVLRINRKMIYRKLEGAGIDPESFRRV